MSEPTKGPYRTLVANYAGPDGYWWVHLYAAGSAIPVAEVRATNREQAEATAQLLAAAWAWRETLEKLARLGNGELYGNSDGNVIARLALESVDGCRREYGAFAKCEVQK